MKKIELAWTDFAREVVHYECPNLKPNFNEFGILMGKVVTKFGSAESVLWSGEYPVGTEDRTWVRTWLFTLGYSKYKDMPQSLDSSHVGRILEKFRSVSGKEVNIHGI